MLLFLDLMTTSSLGTPEALACVSQLLPFRVADFTRFYAPDKSRKSTSVDNYTITDYLNGMSAVRTQGISSTTIADPKAAIPIFKQQLEIVKSCRTRLESSLFDIRSLVQADLYDTELDAALDLNKRGFARAAGALAGVTLEGHLHEVFRRHSITPPTKAMLGGLIEELKKQDVIDIPAWRSLQRLADIRNLCDHRMQREPTDADVQELIDGVQKIIKTLH